VITENDAIDIDIPGNLDSLFSDFDFDRYLVGQEACPVVEYNDSRATNQNTDTPGDQTDGLVSGDGFKKSNTPGSPIYRVVKRRGKAKRRRSQSQYNLSNALYISDRFQVICRSSSTAAAIVEPRRATSRVCLRIAVQNGPNQGLGVAVQV
jgi:hypothetical protein